ncbi:MAG TPA: PilX N-terminal domain-containing pilus assembly protein [Gammaproteobacteria bacterium]|nr:PilX N-terminal domain-containing pilus assembly protein [Gammaproteobacteria bacterium]
MGEGAMIIKSLSRGRVANQRGSVLVVSLLILLVMTLIGVTAMNTSTLEQKMAYNFRDHQTAFQAAEAALRDGEAFVEANSLGPSDFSAACTNGLCTEASGTTPVWFDQTIKVWSTANLHRTATYTAPEVLQKPIYIVEWLGYVFPAGYVPPPGTNPGPGDPEMFRITALATGGTTQARVMLQSTYEKK